MNRHRGGGAGGQSGPPQAASLNVGKRGPRQAAVRGASTGRTSDVRVLGHAPDALTGAIPDARRSGQLRCSRALLARCQRMALALVLALTFAHTPFSDGHARSRKNKTPSLSTEGFGKKPLAVTYSRMA